MSFFKDFPTIFYNGQQAKNLLARAKMTPESKKEMSLFYPYTIKDSDGRPDTMAYAYYNDPQAYWMIFFANDVVDPYFDLGLDADNFQKHIKTKYGTIEKAQSSIAFYRTNWELLEDSTIELPEYANLDPREKHYWEPVLDIYGSIYGYRRKKEDLIVNTNRIIDLSVVSSQGFESDSRISVLGNSLWYATIDSILDETTIRIKHVEGISPVNIIGETITVRDSPSTQVTGAVLLTENIPPDVQAKYWIPVSEFDNESEVNTLKRNIQLVDSRYKNRMEDELKKVMRQ